MNLDNRRLREIKTEKEFFKQRLKEAKTITEKYLSEHRIEEQIPNGYRDGGRNIHFKQNPFKGDPL